MPRRSEKATNFISELDQFTEEFILLTKRHNGYKRFPREPHPTGKPSQLEALPSPQVALDWHDPDQFNRLPAYIRAKYIDSPIALPLEQVMSGDEDWQSAVLSNEAFMAKYGNDVRALYQFPSKEQMEAMKKSILSDSDDSDGSEEPENPSGDNGFEEEQDFDDSASEDLGKEPDFDDIYEDEEDDEREDNNGEGHSEWEREQGQEHTQGGQDTGTEDSHSTVRDGIDEDTDMEENADIESHISGNDADMEEEDL